jgi:Zn-finger nucleic acid-binding protein
MNRQNYGKRSGVIIDHCKEHGVWFDDQELERILAWIRRGGLALSQKRDVTEAKEIQRSAAASKNLGGDWAADAEVFRRRAYGNGDLLWDLGHFLGGLFSKRR